ncbi:MAG TPA: hypothetical protein ENI51_09445 [Candidatus Atribacteria bacterium]|nr:hypothetical protein [Candidatus Atribacteria bacterium]
MTKKTLSYILPEDQYLHVTKMSKEAFTYWHNPKFEPEWTWDDKVIHFEDITQTLLNSSTFKVMASGGSYAVVVKDQVTLEIPIKGKPVMILTSHHANPKDEALRRFPIGAMDNSEQQTEKILERIAQNYSNEESENINTELRSAVRILNPYHVVVPFAELISFFFPKDILMRTHFRRFLDYISASAILHQYQREKTEDGCLIATPDDYMIARMVLIYTTSNIKMVPLSKEYRGILNILRENVEPMTIKDLEVKSDKSKVWLYRHLPFLAERGLVKKDTRFDERANRDVITYQYSLQNNPYAMPTWNDILRKIDEMTNEVDEKTENTEKTNTQNILKDRFFQWMKKLKKQGFYQVFSVGDKASNGKVFSVFSVLSNFLRERDEKKFKKYYMDKEKQSSKDSKEKEESLESFSQSPNETTPSTSNSGTKAELLEIIPYEPDTARLDAVMSHFGYKPSDSDYKSREEYIVELLKDLGRENKIRILDADFNTFAKIKEVK